MDYSIKSELVSEYSESSLIGDSQLNLDELQNLNLALSKSFIPLLCS